VRAVGRKCLCDFALLSYEGAAVSVECVGFSILGLGRAAVGAFGGVVRGVGRRVDVRSICGGKMRGV